MQQDEMEIPAVGEGMENLQKHGEELNCLERYNRRDGEYTNTQHIGPAHG